MEIDYRHVGVELIRQEFESQPPALQEATRRRVKWLLTREAMRNQTVPSALMRIAHIYGLGRPLAVPRKRAKR